MRGTEGCVRGETIRNVAVPFLATGLTRKTTPPMNRQAVLSARFWWLGPSVLESSRRRRVDRSPVASHGQPAGLPIPRRTGTFRVGRSQKSHAPFVVMPVKSITKRRVLPLPAGPGGRWTCVQVSPQRLLRRCRVISESSSQCTASPPGRVFEIRSCLLQIRRFAPTTTRPVYFVYIEESHQLLTDNNSHRVLSCGPFLLMNGQSRT